MADGTPDFTDLLAAFDEAPVVTLHQISRGLVSNAQIAGGTQLLNQPGITTQTRGQYPVGHPLAATQNQLDQIVGLNQNAGLPGQAFIQSSAPHGAMGADESFGGVGSLGSMFLSSVESMLSDETSSFVVPIPHATAKAVQRKPKPQRPKQTMAQQQSRTGPLQQNKNLQNVNAQPFGNINPTVNPVPTTYSMQNTSLNVDAIGMKMSAASPPFVAQNELQQGPVALPMTGQSKSHQAAFVHPNQGPRQSQLPSNPPRPLSAASSSSEHISHPGSVPQPSPSCGSNHSGDPATPLTPQSYNAGTPQPYKPATPQSYKPATPLSNSQQAISQRNTGYGDTLQQSQQILPGMSSGTLENFVQNSQSTIQYQPQQSPMQPLGASDETLNDLPTPLKEAFIPQTTSANFESHRISPNTNDNQLWNSGPAVMAPSALFMNTSQSKAAGNPTFASADSQLGYGFTDMYGMPLQHALAMSRQESNVRSESLTSKQNELLDQMSSFGKSKKPQPLANLALDSNLGTMEKYSDITKPDGGISKNSDNTMNLMNKANDASSAAVKELLGTPYEAISPVSDYSMSPHKSTLHDDLSESMIFSPPKFSNQPDLSLSHDVSNAGQDPLTDPVLMYLKHDDERTLSKNNNSNAMSSSIRGGNSSNFLLQGAHMQDIAKTQSGWIPDQTAVTTNALLSNLSQTLHYSNTAPSGLKNSQFSDSLGQTLVQSGNWNSSLPLTTIPTTHSTSPAQSFPSLQNTSKTSQDGAKNLQTSPVKQRTEPPSPSSKSFDKRFGVSRRKTSVDRAKSGSFKTKKTTAFDSNFGFDDDETAEPTICLSKASPKAAKKPAKMTQPNMLSPKARVAPSKEISVTMEQLKMLQQQQEMLLKLHREYQSQGAANTASNMQNNAQLLAARAAHHDGSRRLSSEKDIIPQNVIQHPSTNSQTVTSIAKHFALKPTPLPPPPKQTMDLPAPLSLAQPMVSPKFGDISKMQLPGHNMPPALPSISQSSIQNSMTSSSHGAPLPNFLGFLNIPASEHGLPSQIQSHSSSSLSGYRAPPPRTLPPPLSSASSTIQSLLQRSEPPTLPLTASGISTTVSSTFFLSKPTYSSKTDVLPTATSFLSFPTSKLLNDSSSVVVSTAVPSMPSSRPQPFDSNFNFDWLNREPEPILSGKFRTPESASEATHTPKSLPMPVSTTTPINLTNSSKVVSSVSLPPDDTIPTLKQSIHTVHHLDVPKSQPPLSLPSAIPSTSKESTPVSQETKHLNLRKHRILEGYPSENYKSTFNTHTTSSSTANTPVSAPARSVLDKQRKYSKDRSSLKPRHRIQHQVTDTPKQPVSTSTSSAVTQKPQSNSSKKTESTKPENFKDDKKDKATDDQAGSMLLLFNSLLQEASESARQDSLKTTLSEPADSKTASKSGDITEAPSTVADTRAKVSKDTPKPAQSISKDSSASSISVTTSVTKVNTTQNDNVPPKKPAKKHRPAATVPFKRRPYPAFDDTTAVPLPTTTAVPVTTTTASLKSVAVSKTTTSTASVASTQVTKSQVTSTAVQKVTDPKISVLAPDDEKSSSKSTSLPKLRITLFRSSKGEVLHQSSMVGNAKASENADSEGSSHRKHHKKKKKKKRRRKISSSDNESVSSRASKSSTADQTAKLAREAKINEQITKELEKKAQSILIKSMDARIPSPVAGPVTKEPEDALKRKRKRTKANTVDDADKKKPPKRVRVSKTINKKKQDSKTDEPVVRYQPKSALHANSTSTTAGSVTKTSVTLPSTFQRAPGKLPLYLTSSEANSATVPTIQLVARSAKQALKTSSAEQKTPPAKVVSVKITNSIPNKSFTTQVLPNSAVQYIIPTTKGQQRVVFPNISLSTPVTVPVSIVSPLFARSFSGGFVPLSVGSLTTTTPTSSTKPQLFSVPVTLGEGVASSIKLLTKQPVKSHVDTLKSIATITSKTEHEAVKLLPAQNSTVTVTKMLTTPRVTTKVISPGASSQTSANTNTFQSTFLKLIGSQNPVSTYTPPAPPPHLELDLSGRKQFQCLECKDSFMFSDSLDHHYDRRCILIKVRCMQCDEDLIFLNKCKLLLHARQHSNKGGNGMQFNNAHISPLPISLCKPRTKEAFLDKTARSAAERRKSSIMSSEDETSSLSLSRQTSFPTILACTDCNFSGSTPAELEEHFQRVSQPVSPDKSTTVKSSSAFTCELCSVSVPNQCSFMAHMRMHKRATPHTCPECGQTFDNDGLQEHAYSESRREIDFNLHLSVQCFHLSRMSAYKCRICNNIFKNAELLRRHLEDRHLQAFYKCRDCPMAFKTQENMSSHQRSAHGVVASTKMIHKCPLCDTVFTDNSHTQQLFLLRKHFEGHMSHPSINITAYKCLFCNNIYERKILLRDHLKSAHDVAASGDSGSGGELSKEIGDNKLVINVEKKDNANTGRKRALIKTNVKEPLHKMPKIVISDSGLNSSASNLLIASGILGNRESSHKKGSKNFSESTMGGKSTVQPLKLRLKGMSHQSNNTMPGNFSEDDVPVANIGSVMRDGRKVFPCGECSKELPSASARLNHIKLKHKGIRTIYSCPHCPPGKIRFAKKISLKKHLKKVHDIEEIKKQDVLIEYVKLPIGQKFDPAVLSLNRDNQKGVQQSSSSIGGENKVRKKFTGMSRKLNRPIRARRDPENINPYVENSDSEVELIMSKRSSEDMAAEKSDNEEPDFSLLKLPSLYTCAKCDFQCEDRLEFQAHIIEHREDGECEGMLNTMQQCTECGLCFASAASHAKHLFIKHKIKRKKLLEKFDRQLKSERAANGNLPFPLSMDGTTAGVNGSASNRRKHKCTVCFKRFDDDGQLRTHMRNHGLAFVKSKHVS